MSDHDLEANDCASYDPTEDYSEEITYKSVQGERRLLQAVLQRAKDDISDRDEKVRAELEEWFSAPYEDGGGTPFSFQYICDNLNLDFESTQKWIFKLLMKNRG